MREILAQVIGNGYGDGAGGPLPRLLIRPDDAVMSSASERVHRRRSGIGDRSAARLVPGLALAGALGTGAVLLGPAMTRLSEATGVRFPVPSPLMAAIVGGVAVANLRRPGPLVRPGTTFAAHRLLRVGVALLGFQLSLGDLGRLGPEGLAAVVVVVAVTMVGTWSLGRGLGLRAPLTLMVATGFAVCGTSAAAAAKEVVGGDDEDMATAVALITLCGTAAVILLPLLSAVLGLGAERFGAVAGASVHDVGQVVAVASSAGPEAGDVALVVKLTRVALLVPVMTVLALGFGRRGGVDGPGLPVLGTRRQPPVPLFLLGFLAAVMIGSSGVVPTGAMGAIGTVDRAVLAVALAGLGTQVRLADLRAGGFRPLVLALAAWLLVLGAALVTSAAVLAP